MTRTCYEHWREAHEAILRAQRRCSPEDAELEMHCETFLPANWRAEPETQRPSPRQPFMPKVRIGCQLQPGQVVQLQPAVTRVAARKRRLASVFFRWLLLRVCGH